jgi:hypothetical protein
MPRGKLNVGIFPALRSRDQGRVILCHLSARVETSGPSDEDVDKWFAEAREWIVRGFADLTAEDAQDRLWQRRKP